MNVQLICQWFLIVVQAICILCHTAIMIGADEGSKRASSFGTIIGILIGTAIIYGAGGFSLTLEQWFK